ncbi:MAG: sigma-70 family RNA polymerase sigma factor [Bryobacteraceae bacterium]|nr:sigma-70 family RNA polymerase sigma factor [Bryobacteraceae bacterium]
MPNAPLNSILGFSGSGQPDNAQDALLIERLRANEEMAYEELIQRFEHPVYNLVYRLLNDPSESADVVQEVFLKVFRKVDGFRGDCSLKTWIYRIAVHESYNQRRWFRRHRQQETALESGDEQTLSYMDVIPDAGPSPFQMTLDHETRERIEAALQEVKPVFRAAVILRDIEELSYEEIASILDTNLGTVKSRILRGREAVRKQLVAEEAAPAMVWAPAGGNS